MSLDAVILRVEAVGKTYLSDTSEAVEALREVSFTVRRCGFVSIVGPSGCGKTTLLKIIAGLARPTSGRADVSRVEDKPGPDIMFVFQEYNRSLFPWRTVFHNVAFGLERMGLSRNDIAIRVSKYLGIVRLEDFAHRYPWELSGGMQQRVAIARALACEPQLLLMDEPFGSLDALSRTTLEDDLLRLWRDLHLTIVFVTHDIDEAIYLSDQVVCLSDRPATVAENVQITLPRPRHQIETKNLREFGHHRAQINRLLGRSHHANA